MSSRFVAAYLNRGLRAALLRPFWIHLLLDVFSAYKVLLLRRSVSITIVLQKSGQSLKKQWGPICIAWNEINFFKNRLFFLLFFFTKRKKKNRIATLTVRKAAKKLHLPCGDPLCPKLILAVMSHPFCTNTNRDRKRRKSFHRRASAS